MSTTAISSRAQIGTLDASGNLYGTTNSGGKELEGGTIFHLVP